MIVYLTFYEYFYNTPYVNEKKLKYINISSQTSIIPVVAKQGTSSLELAEELAETYNMEITTLQDDPTMYMELEKDNADAVINDYPSVAYKINQDGEDSELRIVGDMYPSEDYGIAISRGSEGLVEKMNTGLGELRDSGEFEEIYNSYFSEE
ncbi:hypothetical protein ACDX78_19945 [Virgibacillus oceani]